MNLINKKFFIKKESSQKKLNLKNKPWKIIISDDDKEVHDITKLVLSKESFQERPFEFLSAYSAIETINILKDHSDIALIILDVVMEEEHSGLELVKYIRDIMKNNNIRIILRTGQAGIAPEKEVISKYAINDYREKTELSSQKLFTSVIASLRTYSDLLSIEQNRFGLEKIIKSSASLYRKTSFTKFLEGLLIQITSILPTAQSILYIKSSSDNFESFKNKAKIVAATGEYSFSANLYLKEILDKDIFKNIEIVFNNEENLTIDDVSIIYFKSNNGDQNILYIKSLNKFNELDQSLIEIFTANISTALDNFDSMNSQIQLSNKFFIAKQEAELKNETSLIFLKNISKTLEDFSDKVLHKNDLISYSEAEFKDLLINSSTALNKLIKNINTYLNENRFR